MKKSGLLLIGIFLWSFSQGQSGLAYRLKIGDRFVIRQHAEQIIEQELDGEGEIITNALDGIFNLLVIGKSENQYTLELRFEDLNLKMSSDLLGDLLKVAAREVIEGDVQSKVFNALLNSPVTLTLTRNGTILDVKGGDRLVAKMTDASGILDETLLDEMKKSLERDFGSKALSDSYEQMTYFYPDKKLLAGDTWTNEYHGKIKSKNQWKLDELTDKHAKISGSAQVEMAMDETLMSMLLKGHQETKIKTDLATGFMQTMTVKGSYTGVSRNLETNEEIPTKITSNIIYELINTSHVQQNF